MMSAWALLDGVPDVTHSGTTSVNDSDASVRSIALSRADKATIGRMCKRLIDYGRVSFLCHAVPPHADLPPGLQARLTHYCAVDSSPENCLLLAYQ
jgi:hypothetical protein